MKKQNDFIDLPLHGWPDKSISISIPNICSLITSSIEGVTCVKMSNGNDIKIKLSKDQILSLINEKKNE